MKELEEYVLKLIKENYESNVGEKNDILYIFCSALAIIKIAKATNFGEVDFVLWKLYILSVIDNYYKQAIENKGTINFYKYEAEEIRKWKLEDRK